MKPNLVKLWSHNGPMLVDTCQLNGPRLLLTIYSLRGNRLIDTVRGQLMPCTSVHRDNLYASEELAANHRRQIEDDMRNRAGIFASHSANIGA